MYSHKKESKTHKVITHVNTTDGNIIFSFLSGYLLFSIASYNEFYSMYVYLNCQYLKILNQELCGGSILNKYQNVSSFKYLKQKYRYKTTI